MTRRSAGLLGTGLVLLACGHGEPPPSAPIAHEDPRDEILRLASSWESRGVEKGFRGAPSAIARFEGQVTDRLTFGADVGEVTETLESDEAFTLRDGSKVRCRWRLERRLRVRFGRRGSEPAVEVAWPAARTPRRCDSATFPEPEWTDPPGRARFALSGDQLVGVAPSAERRSFIPVP